MPVVGVRPFLTHGADILHHSYADVDQEVELGNFKRDRLEYDRKRRYNSTDEIGR